MSTYPKKTGITNFDDCVYYLEEQMTAATGAVLPAVSGTDNGKVLKVVSGEWAKANDVVELPTKPTASGTYMLQCTVTDEATTLSWAAYEAPAAES